MQGWSAPRYAMPRRLTAATGSRRYRVMEKRCLLLTAPASRHVQGAAHGLCYHSPVDGDDLGVQEPCVVHRRIRTRVLRAGRDRR